MDADNVHAQMLRATNQVARDATSGNSGTTYALVPDRQFQEIQMIVSAVSVQETRTLTGPMRAGQKLKLSLISTAGATVKVSLNTTTSTGNNGTINRGATASGNIVFTNAGTVVNLEADVTAFSTTAGTETLSWVVRFSNA